MIILVKSAIGNTDARQAIRMTLGKEEFLQTNSIKVLFIDDDYYLNIKSLLTFTKTVNRDSSITTH